MSEPQQGFVSRRAALQMVRLPAQMSAGPLPYNDQMVQARGQSWIIKTPPEGIPARSSYEPGRELCDSFIVDKNPDPPSLLEETNQDAQTLNQYVYNLATDPVAGGQWFIAVQVGDVLVVSSGGGGGGGGAKRVQFRSINAMTNGLINGEVILSEGGPPVGSALVFHDPFNLFMDGAPDAIGWGYLRPANEFCDLEESRWEVEELSLPVNEAVGYTTGCIKKSNEQVEIIVNLNNFLDKWSSYHNVDPPPEAGSGGSIYALNTFKLDTCAQAKVRVRRIPATVPSDSFNCLTPLGTSQSGVEWHVVQVEEQIARWLKVEWTGSEWVPRSQSGGRSLWDGCDPFVGCDIPDIEAPCGQPDCLPSGTCGVAHYNPEAHRYEVTATMSALMGEPTTRLMPVQINEAGALYPCETEVTSRAMCVFDGGGDDVITRFKPATVTIDVVTGATPNSRYIQLSTSTIEVCSTTPGGNILIDICPLLCACDQFYACCEAQCGCEQSDCVWDWDPLGEIWINTIPCPEGCECSGVAPPTPAPNDPTTRTYPCEDPGAEGCCDSMGPTTAVSLADFQFLNPNNFDCTQGVLVNGSSAFSATGPCKATLTFSVRWNNLSCQQTDVTGATATLKVTDDGCCYWEVFLTQPNALCSDGFTNLGDGWPGNTILVPTCDGEAPVDCSTFPIGDPCHDGCSDGGFNTCGTQPSFSVTNIGDCNQ